jgi:hypothetical protein
MKIAVYGVDDLGQALGFRFAENGHTVTFTSDQVESDSFKEFMEKAVCVGAISAPLKEAIRDCQYFILASPLPVLRKRAPDFPELEDRIVVDATPALDPDPDQPLESGTLELRRLCRGGRFVKAFNTVGASVLSDSRFDSPARPVMPICGEDETALEKVSILCDDLGFQAAVLGGLEWSPQLDAMARIWTQLSRSQSFGSHFGWSILTR